MHNFDQDKPHEAAQFVLHGETFTLRRAVKPEKLVRFEEMEEAGMKASEKLAMIDEAMFDLLAPADHDKWRAIRSDETEDAVPLGTLAEVIKWSMGAVSGRPPTQPESSSESPTQAGTQSTDDSPQPTGLMSVPST